MKSSKLAAKAALWQSQVERGHRNCEYALLRDWPTQPWASQVRVVLPCSQLWLVCACAAASILVLDKIVGFLWCPPELLFELLEELYYSIVWKNLPVLLSPHAEVFLACQYSSIKYFQLCMLLTSVYSSGVKPRVQRKWMSCLCSSCSAFTAGCREKTWDLFTALEPSGRQFSEESVQVGCCQRSGDRWCLQQLLSFQCMYIFFFFLPVYEVSSASSFIIIHVSKTDLASVND